MSAKPIMPGVWRLYGGGFVASAQVRDPLDAPAPGHRPKYQSVFAVMRDAVTAKQAYDWLAIECRRIRDTAFDVWSAIPTWKEFAVSVLERKVAAGDIKSVTTLNRFKGGLVWIVKTAPWASLPLNEIAHEDIRRWRGDLTKIAWKAEKHYPDGKRALLRSGRHYSPYTLNVALASARSIWKVAVVRFGLATNPMDRIELFSTPPRYTREEPNALDPRTELPVFLERLRQRYSRWYAFALTGFVLGLKPGVLRALRRRGPNADIDLAGKKIRVRRTHTKGEQMLDLPKSSVREAYLPDELVEVLADHVRTIDASRLGDNTDLLFPSRFTGKVLSTGCITLPFLAVAKEIGIKKRITPRAMSRTYQLLAKAAKADALAAMAVGWHKCRVANPKYVTKSDDDVSEAIVRLLGLRDRADGRKIMRSVLRSS